MASIDLVPGLFFGMFVLLWVSALISWCFGAYYMWKLMHAWRPGRTHPVRDLAAEAAGHAAADA